ncbi:hypothetical protein [Cupriavidus sp. D39]|uniref:hypothetical protein n=1 Tax=Cupriavidus sp. D39 TaxID=2997877 RepID=UPI00226E46E5|nr:hypothetical protein [Cupriavidus sp. D39]MCY0858650.1 hypothetical protein [Cupriavidus sp. D39]
MAAAILMGGLHLVFVDLAQQGKERQPDTENGIPGPARPGRQKTDWEGVLLR